MKSLIVGGLVAAALTLTGCTTSGPVSDSKPNVQDTTDPKEGWVAVWNVDYDNDPVSVIYIRCHGSNLLYVNSSRNDIAISPDDPLCQ